MEQETWIETVKKAQAGDREALEQLLREAHTPVSYQCRKFMRTPEDAEDMTQEVLMVIYRKLNTLTDPAAFHGWVRRIAATRCMNALNRGGAALQFAEDEEGNSVLDTIEELDAQKIPEAALDNAETSRMVVELIDALPEAQRICTYLYYYNELSVREISQLTGATENTVKSRLNYARKAIKEGVLDHEKKGVKLYSLSVLPLLGHFLRAAAQAEADGTAAAACASGVMTAHAAGAAAGAGHAAGILAGKLIAGVLAGVMVLSAGALASVHLVNEHAETVPAVICRHRWEDASCTMPKSCGKCGTTEGEALGHSWTEADCETPQTCLTCGSTQGEALGHIWTEATCETAKFCQACSAVEGEALGHDMAEPNYQQPALCTREGCTYAEGEPVPADYLGSVVYAEFDKEYDYITSCWQNQNYKTVGKLTLTDFHGFLSNGSFEALEGYMYYSVTANILFSDRNAQRYAPAAAGRYGFLYGEAPYSAAKEEAENSSGNGRAITTLYCGKRYTQSHVYWTGWKFSEWDMSTLTCTATNTITWRVPVGYDGYLQMFCDIACEPVEGQRSWEYLNPEALVFRFPLIIPEESELQ